jgi:pyruvate dehydrogenase E1 component
MRSALRRFFEVNRYFVVIAALTALAEDGEIDVKIVTRAIKQYGIDPEKPNPVTV